MGDDHLAYKRSKFATRLPTDRVYTAGHYWMAAEAGGVTRVGFTKFATRMLGEIVEFEFEVRPGDAVEIGQAIGWFEGFKAVTDLYAPVAGHFAAPNPAFDAPAGVGSDSIEDVHSSPYDRGWLYRVRGAPPADCLSATDYAAFLDATIDRMMGRDA